MDRARLEALIQHIHRRLPTLALALITRPTKMGPMGLVVDHRGEAICDEYDLDGVHDALCTYYRGVLEGLEHGQREAMEAVERAITEGEETPPGVSLAQVYRDLWTPRDQGGPSS